MEGAGHGSNATEFGCSYRVCIDFPEYMFLHMLYALRTISRDFKWFFFHSLHQLSLVSLRSRSVVFVRLPSGKWNPAILEFKLNKLVKIEEMEDRLF